MASLNKPFNQRQPDDLVYFDGPNTFADMEKFQREFDEWPASERGKLSVAQPEKAKQRFIAAQQRGNPKRALQLLDELDSPAHRQT